MSPTADYHIPDVPGIDILRKAAERAARLAAGYEQHPDGPRWQRRQRRRLRGFGVTR